MKGEETGTGSDTRREKETTTSLMRKMSKVTTGEIKVPFLRKKKAPRHIPVTSTSTFMLAE